MQENSKTNKNTEKVNDDMVDRKMNENHWYQYNSNK